MTALSAKEMHDQSAAELQLLLKQVEKDLFHLSNQAKREKKCEKPHLIREKRSEKARLLTVLRIKQQKGAA